MRWRPLIGGVCCTIAFALGEILMARSLQLIAPYSHYVHRQLWIDSQAFNAGVGIFLWPFEAIAICAIWTAWANALKSGWRWWWDIAPGLATGALMIGVVPDSSYLGPLIGAYQDAGATLLTLSVFWAFRLWSGSIEAWR